MGCAGFPIWVGIVTGTVILSLITAAIVINRKWEAVKFLCFMKFNILLNDDEVENVDELEFDAFVAYRSGDCSLLVEFALIFSFLIWHLCCLSLKCCNL